MGMDISQNQMPYIFLSIRQASIYSRREDSFRDVIDFLKTFPGRDHDFALHKKLSERHVHWIARPIHAVTRIFGRLDFEVFGL